MGLCDPIKKETATFKMKKLFLFDKINHLVFHFFAAKSRDQTKIVPHYLVPCFINLNRKNKKQRKSDLPKKRDNQNCQCLQEKKGFFVCESALSAKFILFSSLIRIAIENSKKSVQIQQRRIIKIGNEIGKKRKI